MAWTEKYVSVAGDGAHDGTSEADAWTLAEAIAAPYAAGQRINVKAGTYANTTTDRTFSVAGSTTAPIWWRGYKTTIGDLDDGVTLARSLQDGVNLPLWSWTTGQMIVSGTHNIFSNLDILGAWATAGTGQLSVTGANNKFILCRFENTSANSVSRAVRLTTNNPTIMVGCRFKATTTASECVLLDVNSSLLGCHVIGGIIGVSLSGNTIVTDCVVESFVTTGIASAATAQINYLSKNTIYSAATNGILLTGTQTIPQMIVSNNIIGGCTNGINNNTGVDTNCPLIFRNHFYACTNNLVGITELATVDADLGILGRLLDDDNDPFLAKATGDFSLANSAIDIQAGFPGVFEGQTTMVGYPDIGAVQKKAAGGRLLRHPGKGRIRLC